jgi:KaiC/GvpD/RAD55 family RecA-like ATPase
MPGKGHATLAGVGAYQGLPEELAEFLSRDTYSLLIKGESGTGKTILALTILKALQPIENLLYLSTRTSPLQLVENYPWLEDIFGPAGAQGKDVEGWETLVDARLDEPNVVFERITNVLMDKQAPTVVIDSWESLSDTLGSEALRTNIRVLQTWRERAGARFIFIGEDPGNSAIDFMVEGVVMLKERVIEGRRLREAVLSKLHGVQISRPSYFFTLQGGTFTSFPGYATRDYAFRNPLPVSLDRPFRRVKARYPTGYASLDSQLDGGIPSSSTAVVEVDLRVDPRVGLIFLTRIIQDWLKAGDNVVLEKPNGVDRRYMNQFAKSFGAGAKDRLLILGVGREKGGPGLGKGISGGHRKKQRVLSIIGGSSLSRAESGPESHWSEGVRGRADLTLVLGRSGEITQGLTERASVHLKLMEIEGTLFVGSEVPWSGFYAVIPGVTGGNPMIQLEPVV